MRFISLMFLGAISLSVQAQSLCEGFLVLQADINPTLPSKLIPQQTCLGCRQIAMNRV